STRMLRSPEALAVKTAPGRPTAAKLGSACRLRGLRRFRTRAGGFRGGPQGGRSPEGRLPGAISIAGRSRSGRHAHPRGETIMATTTSQSASTTGSQFEVHDAATLASARALLDACRSPEEMGQAVVDAVKRNEAWRGEQCLNLLAPEAPTSPTVRALLAAEIGTRAAEGHIGPVNRWFAGTRYIDEVESLCVELLKQAFHARYADHRLVASMVGNLAVYTALTEPGDVIMSLTQPFGGHSSNRSDGPAGVRGLKIVDIPFDPVELEVDLDRFRQVAPLVRPKVVALGASMTLFPFPLQA